MKKNIIILFIYSFLNNFLIYRACDVLYYLSKGITNSEYINYLTIGSIITIIFLVPFGILKDKFNRKYILLLSNLFLLISVVFYILADNVYIMGIGILATSISNLLSQGIVISLLHSFVNNKDEYSNVYYKWTKYYYLGYLLSMVLGGIVAKYSLISMYYISLIPIILNFIIIFLLDDKIENTKKRNHSKLLLKESLKILKNNKLLKMLLLSELIIIPAADILAESHPEYLSNIGASPLLIGIYTAIMCLFGIIGNKIASIQKKELKTFIISSLLFAVSLIVIGILNNYYTILFILLFQFFYSISNNIYNRSVQNDSLESCRQTLLSIFEFIISIVEIIICTVTSLLFNRYGLRLSYIFIGIVVFLILLIFFFIYYKKQYTKKINT